MRNHSLQTFCCLFLTIIVIAAGGWSTPAAWGQRADANVLAANAAIAYDDKRYDEAMALLDQALVLDPQHERSLFYKGLVYLAQKRPEMALVHLETVHQLRPNDFDIQKHLGIAHFAVGNYDRAKPFLDAVYKQNPETENIGYYVGFLRYRDKQYAQAVDAFEQNQSPDPDMQQLNGFYRGLALGVLGLPNEALSELEQVQRTQTISPLTQASIRIREALSAGQVSNPQKRFRLQISAGGFYDDNVKINPDSVGDIRFTPNNTNPLLVTNNPNPLIKALQRRDETSYGALGSVRADYSFLRNGPFEASATYSFFQTLYDEGFKRFNIQDHLVGLSGFYRNVIADLPFQLGVQYTYDYLFLGGDGFLSRHTPTTSATLIGPTFTLPGIGTVGNITTALYRYQVQTFFREIGNDDIRFRGELRDGYNNTAGLIHAFRLVDDKLLLRIGYQYDNESTEGAAFSYRGNRLLTGAQLQIPWGKMSLRYDYDIHWRDYKNRQTTAIFTDKSGNLTKRDDRQQTHLVQLTKPLSQDFSLTFQYLGIRNKSDIPLYDYQKNSYTFILIWTY